MTLNEGCWKNICKKTGSELMPGVCTKVWKGIRGTAAPLMQIVERDRYWTSDPDRPDFGKPGLVVDLSRRMKRDDVLRCFTRVEPAGDIARAGGLTHNQQYSTFLVSGPRRDPWTIGCPDEISPGVWR